MWESLIWAKNSLIVRSNSLHGRQKFPARVRRELARKILTRLPFWLPLTPPLTPESTKFPAFSLLAGNFEVRDGFARDCPLLRRVRYEPDDLTTGNSSLRRSGWPPPARSFSPPTSRAVALTDLSPLWSRSELGRFRASRTAKKPADSFRRAPSFQRGIAAISAGSGST